MSEAEWDATLGLDLKSVFFAMQAAARTMIAAGTGGRIVNIASISGRSGRPDQAPYAAAKAGVISLTRSAALALAPHGINVNAVCPGVVDTPLTQKIHADRGQALGISAEEFAEAHAGTRPAGAHRDTRGCGRGGVVLLLIRGRLYHRPGPERRWGNGDGLMTETTETPLPARVVDAAVETWGDHPRFAGVMLKQLLTSADNGLASVNMVRLAAGRVIPQHTHPVHVETVYILSGQAYLWLGDREVLVSPGQAVAVPMNTVHGLRNPFDQDLEVLAMFTPPIV